MNILYIGNPTSIHDVRWINYFTEIDEVKCFLISRQWHAAALRNSVSGLNSDVALLGFIADPSVVRPWRNWFVVFRIRRMVAEHKIDLIHILYAEPSALWLRWKKFLRVPIVITCRGTDVLKTIPGFFNSSRILHRHIANLYRTALNTADMITCTSLEQVNSLHRIGVSPGKAVVVRTGIDLRFLRELGLRTQSRQIKKPYLLMPRNMSPMYHHEFTLEAIALLDTHTLNKYSFVFVNSETKAFHYFNMLLRQAKAINADIQFLPSQPHGNLLQLMTNASLVVMNPLSDGSPVSAMEAMACKTPVILPPLNYDPLLFRNTFTFEKWTPVSLKDKILQVLNLPEDTAARHAERNYAAVRRYGNTQIELNKVFKIYAELSKGNRRT